MNKRDKKIIRRSFNGREGSESVSCVKEWLTFLGLDI